MYGEFWTPEQALAKVRERGMFERMKYIRVGNEFRFVYPGAYHEDCLKNAEEAASVTSAGQVVVRPQGVWTEDYSIRLKKGPAADDAEKIGALFSLPAVPPNSLDISYVAV